MYLHLWVYCHLVFIIKLATFIFCYKKLILLLLFVLLWLLLVILNNDNNNNKNIISKSTSLTNIIVLLNTELLNIFTSSSFNFYIMFLYFTGSLSHRSGKKREMSISNQIYEVHPPIAAIRECLGACCTCLLYSKQDAVGS